MNTVADRVTPSITTMIRMDHTHVLALFHRFKADTAVGRKRALVNSACLALEIHAQLEEEIFYPALRNVMSGDPVLEKSEPEHNEMRRLTGELRQRVAGNGPMSDTSLDDKFYELMRTVIHHVADEETRLLPAAERLLRDRLPQLGREMTRRRVELLKPHAGELASNTVRALPGAAVGAALAAGALAVGAVMLSRRKGGRSNDRYRTEHRSRPWSM